MTADRKKLTASDGTKVSYLTEGAGDPVLLLHGFVSSATSWWSIGAAQHLAQTHRVIAPDIRGHGHSDRPTDPSFYGTSLLTDFNDILDVEGVVTSVVIGFSMGAELALAQAVYHPNRTSRLILAGSGWSPPGIVDEYRKWFDRLAAQSDNSEALKALIDAVPEITGLPADRIANLPMPITGIIGEHDDERPYMERIGEVRPEFEPIILDGLDHLGTWQSAQFPKLLESALRGEL